MKPGVQSILQDEFAKRCRRNPRYSLRAFARSAGVAPSRLSDVLNGKRGLSVKNAERISRNLGFSAIETKRFCLLAENSSSRSQLKRKFALKELRQITTERTKLDADIFNAIADWYHLAILELASSTDLEWDPRAIAGLLQIGEAEASFALERLKRLGLVKKSNAKVQPVHQSTFSGGEKPSSAVRRFHEQVLQKAAHALNETPYGERENLTYFVCLDADQFQHVKAEIQEFTQELMNKIDGTSNQKTLFAFTTHLFPLTQNKETP